MERAQEFRWEYYEIGQGHFAPTLEKARIKAIQASLLRPKLTVILELFQPTAIPLCVYKNGKVASWKLLEEA